MDMKKPTLVVDLKRVEQNIKRMVDKFKRKGVQFRPHFKTHQSRFIGEVYRQKGITKCTVSSVGMAQYFAKAGWNDITIAFPANTLEADEMNSLAEDMQLQILVDTVEKVEFFTSNISTNIGLFIEIDTGYNRSGILFDRREEIENIIRAIEAVPQFSFKGFLSHTGNTYSQLSSNDIIALFDDSRRKLVDLKNHFIENYPQIVLSMGDTPAASLAKNFEGIDEMRPGNFVFYDVMQYLLGSCSIDDIAVAVYCPVVAKYPERNQIVIYGGGVHLSKEKILWNEKDIYGLVSLPDQYGFGRILSDSYVESFSQEHGIVKMSSTEINKIQLGDILAVLPVHSCMTVDLNREMISLYGKSISKFRTY
ncbi:MAG: alanine racemase [Bacteroidales bacterium]|nr:alanine racemase [Bacteroidales bacterium]